MISWVNTSKEQLSNQIAERLAELLEKKATTWFVSGGSNIEIQIDGLNHLKELGVDLSKLTILLIDERFGSVGHKDSTGLNWKIRAS